MFEERHLPNRRPGEKIITYVRPHWLHLLKAIVIFLILFILPFVLFFFFQQTLPEIFENDILYVIGVFTGLLFFLFAYSNLYHDFIDRHLDIWIVTNYRVIAIEQKGVFNRTVSEHLIERVQDVSANQKGILQTLFNFGDVEVQTAGEEQNFLFNDVERPFEIAKTINQLLEKKLNKRYK